MIGNEELRKALRRVETERRSGADTRSTDEREQIGERRTGSDRRLASDRRVKPAHPARNPVFTIALMLAMMSTFDIYFDGGRYTIQPVQDLAADTNFGLSRWLGSAVGRN